MFDPAHLFQVKENFPNWAETENGFDIVAKYLLLLPKCTGPLTVIQLF